MLLFVFKHLGYLQYDVVDPEYHHEDLSQQPDHVKIISKVVVVDLKRVDNCDRLHEGRRMEQQYKLHVQ